MSVEIKERILRLPEVLDRVDMKRSSLYKRVNDGEFPRQRSLGGRAVGWYESEVEAWVNSRTTTH